MAAKWFLGVWMILVILGAFFYAPASLGLGQISRIIFFHIPTAWVTVLAFLMCAIYSLRYLKKRQPGDDMAASVSAELGFLFCIIATVSGSIFAKATWGSYWNWDPRETSIFVLLLIYGAYFALRTSVDEPERRGSLSAVYALLAFVTVPILVFVVPRIPAVQSLHPSESVVSTGGEFTMDGRMLTVLLASLAGFTGVLAWVFSLRMRSARLLGTIPQRKED
ncbi:MAG: cytochrome c biogenesis protein [Bacillota bacterium]|jgi:heme exporter protein C|nr:cytochrome c biogenesis protein CcsA [Bacillota bacterium]